MFYIETQRLKLIPLTHQLLQSYHADRALMESSLGLQISSMQIDPLYKKELEDALVYFWLPQTLEHPEDYHWYTNWEIVVKSSNTSVGGIGFIGYPDAKGETEVGYMLDELQQGKGYALEALQGMLSWAFSDTHTNAIIARTAENNHPSRKLLTKAGFIEEGNEEGLLRFRKTNKAKAERKEDLVD